MEPTVVRDDPASADAAALVAALDAELLGLNPRLADHQVGLGDEEVTRGRGVFLVARSESRAVGCGAVTMLDLKTAELKRVYVKPAYRQRGLARSLVSALEAEARGLGATEVSLETAIHLKAAIALYKRSGYEEIAPFGRYVGSDISVCMGKTLDSN